MSRRGNHLSPFVSVEEIEQYLQYVGGGAGALALTGVAAASAFYLTSRPSPQKPLFPLDEQCIVETVSEVFSIETMCVKNVAANTDNWNFHTRNCTWLGLQAQIFTENLQYATVLSNEHNTFLN